MIGTMLSILQGLSVTLQVTCLGLLFALPFMFICGVAQYLATGFARLAVTALIEFWRSSPVIVLLFVFYYSLPAFGITLPAVLVGSMVLGLNAGGYASQAVRAALQGLAPGQVEAGRSLGFRRLPILLLIELPQALPIMMPSFINQFIQLLKGTSLVSLIMLTDMTFRAKEIAQVTYDPAGVYSGLLLSYLIVCYPITRLGRWVEGRVARSQGAAHAI
ncbi:polar amino acid transport system permease protein [Bosea robiniae]|uniref:Polar amino acid transport system permease protein n=2 Tax=Bosea robiniae TaxID=1036780 RepID=A0ABY0NMZ9_9HYPH|nr:polar amino acid transport system permease protein [Bosea robiniae]